MFKCPNTFDQVVVLVSGGCNGCNISNNAVGLSDYLSNIINWSSLMLIDVVFLAYFVNRFLNIVIVSFFSEDAKYKSIQNPLPADSFSKYKTKVITLALYKSIHQPVINERIRWETIDVDLRSESLAVWIRRCQDNKYYNNVRFVKVKFSFSLQYL